MYQSNLTITITCTPAAAPASDTIVSQAATISAASQSRAISNGIAANTRSRLGAGGSNTVSRSGMFFSTQNATRSALETAEYNLWVSGELRNFNGGLDGFSADLTLGVDRLINENMLAGLLLAYGRTDLDDGLGEATVDSPAIGAYFASRFAGDLILDAYLAYARPETETAGTTFKSDRVSAGLMLSGQYALSTGTMRPFARLNASVEDQPAYTGTNGPVAATDLRSHTASVGARFESAVALGSTGLLPYISGAIDYGYTDNGLSASDDFFYPRFGFGVAGPVGTGYVALDVDAGKARSDTYDVGLRLTYEAKF
ncbi:autotransporter outer membrane beta-barrel domain-containing protein [Pseudotabrizicola sediminis]|uniref:Autotransporter outer membrane beta-barrel domain-containing protein n=2 Tax=Pseudotabrizicola sediminis TaxID=2486418 RepID=A0ABY2KQF9_9RHOB|nr:autotransporter outer membrane beta-barrel domain-containing protein [Pseudotabrizicola sediminis]